MKPIVETTVLFADFGGKVGYTPTPLGVLSEEGLEALNDTILDRCFEADDRLKATKG